MSYDFDDPSYLLGSTRTSSEHVDVRPPRDLESITQLLELAAINLTRTPDSKFSLTDLLKEAQHLEGMEVPFEEDTIKSVLGKASFLREVDGWLQLK